MHSVTLLKLFAPKSTTYLLVWWQVARPAHFTSHARPLASQPC
jgi:hypothetical protein